MPSSCVKKNYNIREIISWRQWCGVAQGEPKIYYIWDYVDGGRTHSPLDLPIYLGYYSMYIKERLLCLVLKVDMHFV